MSGFFHLKIFGLFEVVCFGTPTSSARMKSFFSAANRITSCIDFLLWTWPRSSLVLTAHDEAAALWCNFILFFYTCGISRIDDVQSHRFTDSLCRLQGSMQLLLLQLPALLLIEIVRNRDCSHLDYARYGWLVTWAWGEDTCSEWTLVRDQDLQHVLTGRQDVEWGMMLPEKACLED